MNHLVLNYGSNWFAEHFFLSKTRWLPPTISNGSSKVCNKVIPSQKPKLLCIRIIQKHLLSQQRTSWHNRTWCSVTGWPCLHSLTIIPVILRSRSFAIFESEKTDGALIFKQFTLKKNQDMSSTWACQIYADCPVLQIYTTWCGAHIDPLGTAHGREKGNCQQSNAARKAETIQGDTSSSRDRTSPWGRVGSTILQGIQIKEFQRHCEVILQQLKLRGNKFRNSWRSMHLMIDGISTRQAQCAPTAFLSQIAN